MVGTKTNTADSVLKSKIKEIAITLNEQGDDHFEKDIKLFESGDELILPLSNASAVGSVSNGSGKGRVVLTDAPSLGSNLGIDDGNQPIIEDDVRGQGGGQGNGQGAGNPGQGQGQGSGQNPGQGSGQGSGQGQPGQGQGSGQGSGQGQPGQGQGSGQGSGQGKPGQGQGSGQGSGQGQPGQGQGSGQGSGQGQPGQGQGSGQGSGQGQPGQGQGSGQGQGQGQGQQQQGQRIQVGSKVRHKPTGKTGVVTEVRPDGSYKVEDLKAEVEDDFLNKLNKGPKKDILSEESDFADGGTVKVESALSMNDLKPPPIKHGSKVFIKEDRQKGVVSKVKEDGTFIVDTNAEQGEPHWTQQSYAGQTKKYNVELVQPGRPPITIVVDAADETSAAKKLDLLSPNLALVKVEEKSYAADELDQEHLFQILSPQGYFSRSMSSGKPVFIDSSEMGYTYPKAEAERILSLLKQDLKRNDLTIVPYVPYVAEKSHYGDGGVLTESGGYDGKGKAKYRVDVTANEAEKDGGAEHTFTYTVEAKSDDEALKLAEDKFQENWKYSDLSFKSSKIRDSKGKLTENGGLNPTVEGGDFGPAPKDIDVIVAPEDELELISDDSGSGSGGTGQPQKKPDIDTAQLMDRLNVIRQARLKLPYFAWHGFKARLGDAPENSHYFTSVFPLVLAQRIAKVVYSKNPTVEKIKQYSEFVHDYKKHINTLYNGLFEHKETGAAKYTPVHKTIVGDDFKIIDDGYIYIPLNLPTIAANQSIVSISVVVFHATIKDIEAIIPYLKSDDFFDGTISLKDIAPDFYAIYGNRLKQFGIPDFFVALALVGSFLETVENIIIADNAYYQILTYSLVSDEGQFKDKWIESHLSFMFKLMGVLKMPLVLSSVFDFPNGRWFQANESNYIKLIKNFWNEDNQLRNLDILNVIKNRDGYLYYLCENLRCTGQAGSPQSVFSVEHYRDIKITRKNEISFEEKLVVSEILMSFYFASEAIKDTAKETLNNLELLFNLQLDAYRDSVRNMDIQLKLKSLV